MPVPTPAKCNAESSLRPSCAKRSNTMVEERISTNALAAPPTNRRTSKAASDCDSPIPAVVAVLAANEPINHSRRGPLRRGMAAAKAPIK